MKQSFFIVEDSLFIREIYRLCLKNINLEFIGEAVDGIDAVEKIKKLKPDIVLLDLVLPEKNGFDVLSDCSHLKTKFIVISSLPAEDYEQKTKSLGALFYLEKPFKKQQLIQIIESTMNQQLEVKHG
jgi:YesN/AraC family two-component response regulator